MPPKKVTAKSPPRRARPAKNARPVPRASVKGKRIPKYHRGGAPSQHIRLTLDDVLDIMEVDNPQVGNDYDDWVNLDCSVVNTGRSKSGWNITGVLHTHQICYCDEFHAQHDSFGSVWSTDLNNQTETSLYASSVPAIIHFWMHHGQSFGVENATDN